MLEVINTWQLRACWNGVIWYSEKCTCCRNTRCDVKADENVANVLKWKFIKIATTDSFHHSFHRSFHHWRVGAYNRVALSHIESHSRILSLELHHVIVSVRESSLVSLGLSTIALYADYRRNCELIGCRIGRCSMEVDGSGVTSVYLRCRCVAVFVEQTVASPCTLVTHSGNRFNQQQLAANHFNFHHRRQTFALCSTYCTYPLTTTPPNSRIVPVLI